MSSAGASAGATLIRDLDVDEFSRRYGADRFTATVLANRFHYIVGHVCGRLLTAAFSPILRDFYDFAATLTGPPALDYPTPAMSNSIVLFTGTMTDSVRNTINEYGPERLGPGDVIVANDPYRTGTHVNDLLFCRPVFDGDRLAGFVNLKAHQLDMGGVVPGGFSLTKHNVFETGLVVSPRALYRGGEPVRETWSLIFDNVRFGEILFPDMQTICAGLTLGERLLTETIARYGFDAVQGAMGYVCDAAAERMSLALAAIEDGEWEGEDAADCDGVDDSEEYRVHVKITKRGGRAEVDFSGTSRQARTCINATALDAKTTVGVAFKYLFDPRTPFSSGTWRDIDTVIPEGSVVSALPPDGAVFLYYEQSQVMIGALLRALAKAVGPAAIAGDRGTTDIHSASGVHPNGMPWVSAAQLGGELGPFGATEHGDADTWMLSYQANGIVGAVEAIESDVPAVLLREEPVPDTGGPGFNRGGLAVRRDSLWLQAASHNLMSLHYRRPAGFGVNGGGDGRNGGVWLWPPDGETPASPATGDDAYADSVPLAGLLNPRTNAPDPSGRFLYPYRQPSWHTDALTVLRYINRGGGGWGDPLTREPERVLIDVRDGYVTVAGAARDYGVVVIGDPDEDPEGLVIDEAATAQLRTARHRDVTGRSSRGSRVPVGQSGGDAVDLSMRVGRVAAPLREQVLDVLRQAILDFRLKPGQRLIERELIEQTGVSRTTIREVLRQLAAEGLVTTIPQKGAIVVVPSAQEAADLYEVRAALEALACRRFVRNATDSQVKRLRRSFREIERLAKRRDPSIQEMLAAKDDFYDVLLEGAGNRAIRETLDSLRARVRLLRATSLSQPNRSAGTVSEIGEIVRGAEARDEDAMAAACEYHVNQAARSGLTGLVELDRDYAAVFAPHSS